MPPHFPFGAGEKPPKISWERQKELLRSFCTFYSPHKKLLALSITVAVLSPAFNSCIPVIILLALQKYLPDGDVRMTIWSLAAVIFLLVGGTICDYISMRWGEMLGFKLEKDMRHTLMEHLQKLSFSYFDQEKTGVIISKMTNDLTTVSTLAHRAPNGLISASLRLLFSIGIMIHVNWRLTLFAVLPLPFLILWIKGFQGRMRESFLNVRKDIGGLNATSDNCIKGIRETQSFTAEDRQLAKFDLFNGKLLNSQGLLRRTMALFHSGMHVMLMGYTRVFILIGIILALFGLADTAELIVFSMYSHSITFPLMMFIELIEQYQQGMAAFERFQDVVDTKPEIADFPNAITSLDKPLVGEIILNDVHFTYRKEDGEVLCGINAVMQAGKKTALVGESGAGKSTLASLIPRFYERNSGSIQLDGHDIRDYSLAFLRGNIGFVSQFPYLFDATLGENIALGLPNASEEQICQAAKFAGIHDFIMSLPEKYNSRCGENGVRLSGGQRQRIAIARVFLKNPAIIILDEATSSLDNESEAFVQEAFNNLCRNRTSIVIAHRLSTIQDADMIYCMKDGNIIEQGTHQSLLKLNGFYTQLNKKALRDAIDA